MADNKPKLIRGKGRPSFKMTKPVSFPHLQKQAHEARIASKTGRDVAQLKETQKAGRSSIRAAASQKRATAIKETGERFRTAMQKTAAKSTGSAVVEYKAPKTKPTAPTPSPAKAAPKKVGALRKFLSPLSTKHLGKVGTGTKLGRIFSGKTGANIIKGAAGKGLLRGGAMKLVGMGLRVAGPVGAAYGAASAVYTAGKRAKEAHRIGKPVFTFGGEGEMKKRSKEKYGTVAAAARTRKAMTGR